ncbi:MAG TPA: SRPBCC family protein [Mycobacteriales bacterium]|nr:SRPBCC family protein [Mycobacteriales bacterium]
MPKRSRKIAAPAAEVWAVLADFPAIASWAPNVDHSVATTAARQGIGAVRRVQTGRITLLETVVDWRPGELLSYTLDGLPPIAGSVVTTWQLAESGGQTKTTVSTVITSRPNPVSRIVGRALSRQLARAAKQMLGGLAARVEEGSK